MYSFLRDIGFSGLEVAPTRLFPEQPYDHLTQAADFARQLWEEYGLRVCSMQSIWYGRGEQLFGSPAQRQALLEYTKRAIDFAQAMLCTNLVFGCPKNRSIPSPDLLPVAYDFFAALAHYAARHDTVLALEPNPPIYQTNFINTTAQALDFCRQVSHPGLKVNLDLGACIDAQEDLTGLRASLDMINHIHLSEPMLVPLKRRALHKQLTQLDYRGFCSIEMRDPHDLALVKEAALYIKETLL
jgi:sugar phosphate isomerase/epimerase